MVIMRVPRSVIENILLVTLLLFAPLALGAVHVWSYSTLAILALILFNLHFLPDPARLKRVLSRAESIGALAFLAVILIYITPLPAEAIKALSPNTYNLWQNYTLDVPKFMTLSVYPHATVMYIIKFVTYFLVFLVVVSKIQSTGSGYRVSGIGQTGSPNTQYSIPATQCSYILLGALCAVLSILFHSLSDFNLHIPANALYFTVMLAIIAGLTQAPSVKRQAPSIKDPAPGSLNTQYSILNTSFISFLTTSLILIGFSVALLGIVQKLSYNGKIYWMIEKAGSHFGPYVNYDHYAGFMEVCAIFTISVFMEKIVHSSFAYTRRLKDKIVWFSTKEANKALIYLFAAVVMTTALFMTTSRGGIMSFVGAFAVFYFACVISARKKMRNRIILSSVLVIVLIAIMFAWVGPEETLNRFKTMQRMIKTFIKEKAILSELRPYFWKDTLNLIGDFPITGTGLGTYRYIFTGYRTFSADKGFLQFAHNDYLQLFAEMGAIGVVFAAGFLVWYVRKFMYCLRRLKEQR